MGNLIGELAKAFAELVEVVAEHPKESAAVAVAVGAVGVGYAAGYRDGRNDSDQNNQKLLATYAAMYNPPLK